MIAALLPLPSVRHMATALGALIVGTVLVMAIIAPLIAPHDPFAQDLNLRLVPPEWMDGGSAEHPLGTDQLGRDYLSRLIFGARVRPRLRNRFPGKGAIDRVNRETADHAADKPGTGDHGHNPYCTDEPVHIGVASGRHGELP